MKTLILDIETRSVADLKETGAWVYSEHSTTDIICLAWKEYKAKDVKMWRPGDKVPGIFFDSGVQIVAHNALFEHAIFANVLCKKYDFPYLLIAPSVWYCTRAMGVSVGMPGHLKDLAKALKVTHKKQESGVYLINRYSKPIKKGVNEFRKLQGKDKDLMIEYNKGDVLATEDVYTRLKDLPNIEKERCIYLLDMKHNVKGLFIDVKSLKKVNSVLKEKTKQIEKDIEPLGVNVRSVPQLKDFLKNKGFNINNVQKKTIDILLTKNIDKDTKLLLEARLFLGKASTKKYVTLLNRVSSDGYLRHFLQYFGAHTGRYSSFGVQLHNLPKSDTDEKEITKLIKDISINMSASDLITNTKKILPGLIIAPTEHTFLLGDFAAIEARGLAYLAEETHLLNLFKSGQDPYIDMAATVFKKQPEKITKKERKLGKIIILASGYGMGVTRFEETCKNWGVEISTELATKSINTFRTKYRNIYNFWYGVQDAFRNSFLHKKQIRTEYLIFEGKKNYVKITLPNGRDLFYHGVKITTDDMTYINRREKKQVYLWGGILTENIVQAMCRDILTDRLLECEKQELKTMFHVHDEIIVETNKVREDKQKFEKIMNTAPNWLPDFPLSTEIEISKRYHK